MCVSLFVRVVGSSENPQRCLRGVSPHKGLWETDAAAKDAEEAEGAGAPSTGLLAGTRSHRHTHVADTQGSVHKHQTDLSLHTLHSSICDRVHTLPAFFFPPFLDD